MGFPDETAMTGDGELPATGVYIFSGLAILSAGRSVTASRDDKIFKKRWLSAAD
jgi:hypothetical protein